MFLIVVLFEAVSSKMIDSSKHDLIKNVFKQGKYFLFPVTGQYFSAKTNFPGFNILNWKLLLTAFNVFYLVLLNLVL